MTQGRWIALWMGAAGAVLLVGRPVPAPRRSEQLYSRTAPQPGPRAQGPTPADLRAARAGSGAQRARTGRRAPVAITWANLTTASSNSTGTTLAASVPAGGVATGRRVVVAFAMPQGAGTVSCTDSRGNTYSADRDVSSTGVVRLVVFSSPITVALQEADTITVTAPSSSYRAAAVLTIAGLTSGGVRDQTVSATGTSASPDSGSATTTVADEALFGVVATHQATSPAFTAGTGWTAGTEANASAGGDEVRLYPEYRTVSSTGSYRADGSFFPTADWAAVLVTYSDPVPENLQFSPSAVSAAWTVPSPTVAHAVTLTPSAVAAAWGFSAPNWQGGYRRPSARENWWRR